MNIPMLDQSRKKEDSTYGECVKLSNELRNHNAIPIHDDFGRVSGFTNAKIDGFDIETGSFNDLKRWFLQTYHTTIRGIRKRKSDSLITFVFTFMFWRFETETISFVRSTQFPSYLKNEAELIMSDRKKEVEYAGTKGFQNLVRLDGSLTNPKSRVVRLNNDRIKVVRK